MFWQINKHNRTWSHNHWKAPALLLLVWISLKKLSNYGNVSVKQTSELRLLFENRKGVNYCLVFGERRAALSIEIVCQIYGSWLRVSSVGVLKLRIMSYLQLKATGSLLLLILDFLLKNSTNLVLIKWQTTKLLWNAIQPDKNCLSALWRIITLSECLFVSCSLLPLPANASPVKR